MSDIPVGSPPAPPGRHAAPSGWYPDPVDPAQERYWDGWQWSRNVRPREGGAPAAAPAWGAPAQPVSSQQPMPPSAPVGPDYRPAPLGGSLQSLRTSDGVPLAGWWWRALAVWLDSIVVSLLVVIPAFPIYQRVAAGLIEYFAEAMRVIQSGGTPPSAVDINALFPVRDQLTLTAIQIAAALVFHIVFLRWKSATPGKLICGLRVVPVDQGRSTEQLPWRCVVVRALVWVLPAAHQYLLAIRVVDAMFPLWQPKRQALHDLAAKTQVVKIR